MPPFYDSMQYFVSGKYPKGERATLLKYICAASGTGWTKSSSFTFRNPQRIFGSPLLDAALKGPDSDSQKALEALIEEIQEA